MVVVDAPAAPGVPVLSHGDLGVGLTVGQRVVDVGGVTHGIGGRGAVDEPPVRRRDDHPEGGACRHRHQALIEDRPPLLPGLIPDAYVAAVGGIAVIPPARGRLGEDDGVGVAVYARVGEVGVVAPAV